MRLLFVVQRYGLEVAGGAELLCREFATRLAARGHDVHVLTSCATSYIDWANVYPPGETDLDGVAVHRLPVLAPRPDDLFGRLNTRVVWGRRPTPLSLQEHWLLMQGPFMPELVPWLEERAAGYDTVAFFTYLYYPTWAGLPVVSRLAPTVLHPTAHQEPALDLEVFDTMLRHPAAFACSTPEEADLLRRRIGRPDVPAAVIGVGIDIPTQPAVDLPADVAIDDGALFRTATGVGDRPYLLFAGRLDPAKGSEELFHLFTAYKRRHPGPLTLAMVGDAVRPLPAHPDVVVTGFVEEAVKSSAFDGALALVQPSYFESFSLVLTEAWLHRKMALVQGHCDVLAGQVCRSGGGLPYRDYPEFEAAVDWILTHPDGAAALGRAGRAYVEANYRWDVVLDRYDELLVTVTGSRRTEPGSTSSNQANPSWTRVSRNS